MSLQHVIVLFDTLSLISMQFAATLFFILRRKSTTVQSSWRNCMFQDLQTYNGDTPKGKCTSSWYGKNGDGFPTNLRFRNPFQICSFLLLQPRHMIYLNVHALRTQNNPVRRLASYCSFDTLWNASAKARPLPMSQSIKMPCMRQANVWKQKNCLRMHDSTGPLALHLQFWSNCLLQFASSLLY